VNPPAQSAKENPVKTLVAAALLAVLFASSTALAFQPLTREPQPIKVDHGDDVK
jgi:hypothetical protein